MQPYFYHRQTFSPTINNCRKKSFLRLIFTCKVLVNYKLTLRQRIDFKIYEILLRQRNLYYLSTAFPCRLADNFEQKEMYTYRSKSLNKDSESLLLLHHIGLLHHIDEAGN